MVEITDYIYDEKGNIISSASVKFKGAIPGSGELRGYGYKGFRMASGAITDDSLNFASNIFAIGEIYSGVKLMYMGLTTVPKASVGIRTVLGASISTLRSSVYFEKMIGKKSINILGIKSLPTLFGKAYTWGTFYGRNAAIIGAGRVGIGGSILYN